MLFCVKQREVLKRKIDSLIHFSTDYAWPGDGCGQGHSFGPEAWFYQFTH